MVVGDGFEPSKSWTVDLQSTAFDRSATPPGETSLERVEGIEPSQSAWKADVLPLNYTRARSSLSNYYTPRREKIKRKNGGNEKKC